ncbi:MAG: RHS repeat-associated core domain-containing protein, partial [Pyrinomonadaceae bacterium]
AGRVNQVTFPDGSAIHTSFGLKTNAAPLGAMTLETDQAGKERLALTDASGNLTDVWEIRGADSETSTVLFQGASQTGYRTSYLYDVFGKLHEVQQGSQHRYFMYDSLGRLIRAKNVEQETNTNLPAITDPVSQHSGWAQAYTYDPNGNLLVTTTARNATITNIYDAMSRVTKRDYSDAAMPDVEYKYDTETNGLGKPASVSNGLVTTRFTEYSIVGELLKSQQEFAGVTQPYTFEYTYNLAGQMVSEKYPSGRVVTNTFDSLGKLASVSSGALNQTPHIYANGFGYNEKGVMDRMRLGDGLWESYQVNSRFQTTEIDLGTSANSTNRLRLNYSYGGADNNGNVRSQTITVPTINGATGFVTTQDYTYDDLNRLASVKETQYGQTTPDWQQQFAYDRYGNRAMGTGSGQTFGRNSAETLGLIGPDPTVSTSTNRIINKTGEQYQFDASGNMTRDALGNRSVFDVENHQTEYFYAANTTQTADAKYFYDGDGRRIKKVIGTETTIFVYNAAGKMAAEYTLGASANSNPQTNYLTTDTLGSTRVVTNSSGQIIARHDYLPFGDEMLGLGGRTSAQGFGMPDTTRQRFTGYERDSESGLDFAQARYYGNGLGRFTGVDPLMESATPQIPQSWNRYGYCINNPLAITDPSGLIWGYQDTERDGMIWRQFQWFNGKKVDKGFTPFEGTSFTYADGKTLLLGDEGAWDWARQTQELDSGSLTPFARAFVAEMGRRNEHFGRNLVLVVGSAWLVGATGGSALFEAGPFVAYTTMAGDALIMEKNYREQAAEEKAALAEVNIAGSLEGDRRWAVKEAWHQESEFAKQTGRGATVNWTASELGQLTTNGKVAGYQGHHVNSVKGYPDMARNPDNVRFLTRADHFNEHGGNWSNRTTGSLCTRKLR